jgi:hypothetical protein
VLSPRQRGINEHTLSWWNWRFGAGFEEADIVEITVAEITVAEAPSRPVRVHLGRAWVDIDRASDIARLRRIEEQQIDVLAAVGEPELGEEPREGTLVLFTNRARIALKALVWTDAFK